MDSGSGISVKTTIQFKQLKNSLKRISLFQGGTRSGKTYNILLWFILKLLDETKKVLTISRGSMPSLRGSAMRDFFEILEKLELYSVDNHNKSENIYRLNNNIVEFVGLDESIKVRGRKRDYWFANESNEMNYETFLQLAFRTTDKIVMDYNPHEQYSWIYDKVITRDDAELFISDYRDNPFLDQKIISEIERLKTEDDNYWRVYGLGLIGYSVVKIYNNWKVISLDEWNEAMLNINEVSYGLDFGFNVPTALIETNEKENNIYVREIIYKSHLLNSELISEMNKLGISKIKYINADGAEPDKIKEISNVGYNIRPAVKSVNNGIDYVQRKKLFIHPESENTIKEIKGYSWKATRDGKILDEPVKANDHSMDALRYSLFRKGEPVFYQR